MTTTTTTTSIKLYIDRPDDRDAVVTILAKNGYTVRQGKEKDKTGRRNVSFVEAWRGDLKGGANGG